jgi:hypothetical protein
MYFLWKLTTLTNELGLQKQSKTTVMDLRS